MLLSMLSEYLLLSLLLGEAGERVVGQFAKMLDERLRKEGTLDYASVLPRADAVVLRLHRKGIRRDTFSDAITNSLLFAHLFGGINGIIHGQ